MPFGYPKRVFNIFPLRDLPDLTVIDSVGKRNGCTFICRFPWRSEGIMTPFPRPLYKERWWKLILSYLNPSYSSQSSLLPSGCTLSDNTFTIVISHEQTIPFPETPCLSKARDGSVRARVAETQDLSPLPFSQNPKQGLVTSHFRCDWVRNIHHHHHPLSHEHI